MFTAIIRTIGEARKASCFALAEQLLGQGINTRIITQFPGNTSNQTLERAITEPADTRFVILFEDDAFLCPDFHERLLTYVQRNWPLLSGFSRRKEDLQVFRSGQDYRIVPYPVYYSTMCLLILNELRSDLAEFCQTWYLEHESRTAADLMCSAWAQSRKLKIRVAIPSLIQHRSMVSVIDRRRSRNRQSETFRLRYGEVMQ